MRTIPFWNEMSLLSKNIHNLSSVGHSLGQYLLYIDNGLFPDEKTIHNNPDQKALGYTPQPGDIWYHNLPNYRGEYDNVIDGNDRRYVGNPQDPEIVYGFGPSIKFRNGISLSSFKE